MGEVTETFPGAAVLSGDGGCSTGIEPWSWGCFLGLLVPRRGKEEGTCMHGTNCLLLPAQVMQKDSEKNMSIKKLWK